MGACYSVEMRVKIDPKSIPAATAALKDVADHEERYNANFMWEKWDAEVGHPETFDDYINFFLAGWKSQPVRKSIAKPGDIIYDNGFSASYGWQSIMEEAFKAIAPYLKTWSRLDVWGDSWHNYIYVKNGKIIEK